MPLGKHKKTSEGQFRKERGDSLAKNLAKDYSEFESLPGNTRLDALEKKYGVSGVGQVRKALKKNNS